MLRASVKGSSFRFSGLGVSVTADIREGEGTAEDIPKGVPNGEHIAASYEFAFLPHGECLYHVIASNDIRYLKMLIVFFTVA